MIGTQSCDSCRKGRRMNRIGLGYDVHAFAEGRRLVLGGVEIPHDKRDLTGIPDADVLVHAIMDAIVGAMRAGDIGKALSRYRSCVQGCGLRQVARARGRARAGTGLF